MFLTNKPVIKDGVLSINGKDTLTGVPDNVVVTPLSNSSAFVGATSTLPDSRHVFRLGLIQYAFPSSVSNFLTSFGVSSSGLRNLMCLFLLSNHIKWKSIYSNGSNVHVCACCRDIRLLCLFRFKLWWMIPRMGNSGQDIPIETQMLLLEAKEEPDGPASYILFLPVLDGEFRSSLQGNQSNELELCVESGKISLDSASNVSHLFGYFIDSDEYPAIWYGLQS